MDHQIVDWSEPMIFIELSQRKVKELLNQERYAEASVENERMIEQARLVQDFIVKKLGV